MQENFKPRTGADRFAGIGTLIFNMIKNKQPMVDGIARHLGVNRNQVVDAEGDIKLMAAYCYLPRSFSITVQTLAGGISVEGGQFDNHLPKPTNKYRPMVPPFFLEQKEKSRQPV
jgi:hypothetical protein